MRVDIQADFWNGDPDIDAICRMEHAPECDFDPAAFPIASNKLSPFNSQNTFFAGNVIKDYFLYPHVGRMDDIWAAYYVQAKDYRVVYGKASVYQDRNVHDLIRDMRQEYLGYENNLAIVQRAAEEPQDPCSPICRVAQYGRSSFTKGISSVRKILITGAAGFVGRHLVRHFLEHGDEVHAVDCVAPFTGGIDPAAGWPIFEPRDFSTFKFFREDCRDFFKRVRDTDYEYALHLAAMVGGRAMIENKPIAVADDLSIDAEYWQWATLAKPGENTVL